MKTYIQKHDRIKYSDHWSTPKEIYDHYVNEKNYLDPCKLYDDSTDIQRYDFKENMFINPPYSNITEWVEFAINNSYYNDTHIVLLIPSRTDTRYFHRLLNYGVTLEFIKGRLKFGDHKGSAPFPSVLVHINKK
ncbi:MAG: DNA N-6-adenine-methyltransferase [Candidatus Cloacimonetes bacterium]|nr:DNA N-6-adenine-methyltransferase [Candidatus Cloacimonadota bacterium]